MTFFLMRQWPWQMGIEDNNADSLLRQPSLGLRPRVRENITGKFLNYLVSYPAIYPSIYPSITLTIYLSSYLSTYLSSIDLLSIHPFIISMYHSSQQDHSPIYTCSVLLLTIHLYQPWNFPWGHKESWISRDGNERPEEAGSWLQLATIACT